MPMVCYYLEVIKLLFFPTFMSTELGWVGERGGEIFVSKPLFFQLVSRKLFPAFLRPSYAYFFFKAQPWRYFITVYWFGRKVMQISQLTR